MKGEGIKYFHKSKPAYSSIIRRINTGYMYLLFFSRAKKFDCAVTKKHDKTKQAKKRKQIKQIV